MVKKTGATRIDDALKDKLDDVWKMMSAEEIRAGIKNTLDNLLDNSENKTKKIELLQKNVLNDQKVKKLKIKDWIEILDTILMDIYRYIDADSSEGQDILNLFFIAFNKYTGKADKNQAFTPDHITEFMCRITDVDRTKVVLDGTCGSGSFLVQAMVKEIADCRRDKTEKEAEELIRQVKEKHIFGIEVEEKAYGLSTTNMLIHGDGNSNIKFGSILDSKKFIMEADPDIILMNPPYNAKPIGIPAAYKTTWTAKAKDGKEDPTKGFVFVHFISDVIKELNDLKEKAGKYDELQENSKTELQKANEKAARLEKELGDLKKTNSVRVIREKISGEMKVPAELLTGEDEETCKKQAEAFLKYIKPSRNPDTKPKNRRNTGGHETNESL